jgi:hypothetical protein
VLAGYGLPFFRHWRLAGQGDAVMKEVMCLGRGRGRRQARCMCSLDPFCLFRTAAQPGWLLLRQPSAVQPSHCSLAWHLWNLWNL